MKKLEKISKIEKFRTDKICGLGSVLGGEQPQSADDDYDCHDTTSWTDCTDQNGDDCGHWDANDDYPCEEKTAALGI